MMARGTLYLIFNITEMIYAPEKDAALWFRSHIFPVKPKARPGNSVSWGKKVVTKSDFITP